MTAKAAPACAAKLILSGKRFVPRSINAALLVRLAVIGLVASPTSTSGNMAVGVSACGPVPGSVRMEARLLGTPLPVISSRRPSSGIAAVFVAASVTLVAGGRFDQPRASQTV